MAGQIQAAILKPGGNVGELLISDVVSAQEEYRARDCEHYSGPKFWTAGGACICYDPPAFVAWQVPAR